MPLTETYPRGVLFVGGTITTREGPLVDAIVGTAFLASVKGPRIRHPYIVTAAHVLKGIKQSFVRMGVDAPDGVRDVPVHQWFESLNPNHDVAVSPIVLPTDHALVATGLEQFVDDTSWETDEWIRTRMDLELGDLVYFVGLLGKVQAMADANIPIVRSGTLARLWQDDMPVIDKSGNERRITAHLIDCRSFGGFSGSPCYVEHSRAGIHDGGVTTKYRLALLGMIGGHFDDWAKVKSQFGDSDLVAPVNTGVGYVLPAEFIRETLMREELVEMRRVADEAAEAGARRNDEDNAATMDSVDHEVSEFERFENLTRELVNTPKSEVDKKRKSKS